MDAGRRQPSRAAFFGILHVDLRQCAVQIGNHLVSQQVPRDLSLEFRVDFVPVRRHVRHHPELLDHGHVIPLADLLQRQQQMVDMHLLARDARHVAALANESQHGGVPVEPGHLYDVVDVVPVKAARGRQQDRVVCAGFQFVAGEYGWVRGIHGCFGNELVIVPAERENARRRMVLVRNREVSFAGQETQVAHGYVAVIVRKSTRLHAHAAAQPAPDEFQVRPAIPRTERPDPRHHVLEEPRALRVRLQCGGQLSGKLGLVRQIDARGAVVDRADDGFRVSECGFPQSDERAGIGRADVRNPPGQREPCGCELSAVVVLDLGHRVRDRVGASDQPGNALIEHPGRAAVRDA